MGHALVDHPLDRPIWTALMTNLSALAEGGGRALRLPANISPLAAAADWRKESVDALITLIPPGDDVSLMEPAPPPAPSVVEEKVRRVCVQMSADGIAGGGVKPQIEALGDKDAPEMLALALLTKPGPFRARTHTLGRFIGVRENGALIAMAGERLRAPGFTEISAVCTHPDYRGRGLGAALMRAVADRILSEGDTPFLHSYADNAPAVALYQHLGFVVRTELTHLVWAKA